MNGFVWSIQARWPALLVALVACASGCTSAISTAYLRDTLWDISEHAAEEQPAADEETAAINAAEVTDDVTDTLVSAGETAADEERRAAAIDEAVARLARLGVLDEATRETLMETLQGTQQEDWPVVVEAFADSLESAATASAAAQRVVERAQPPMGAASHVVAKADLDEATSAPPAAPEPLVVEQIQPDGEPAPPPTEAALAPEPLESANPPAVAKFEVRNACFASRVQAWGVVERFPDQRFRPGQELIVYFELGNLSAGESSAGHTTCIDASLKLLDNAGRVVHDWSFEPIAETCVAKRHDYFARYVIRIPETAAAGDCRLDVDVVDTLAGTAARASLPLEIAVAAR